MRGSKPINARAICETRRVRAVLGMCGECAKNSNAASHPRPQLERVACPGFTADCLETLDEIGNEGREQIKAGGGKAFWLVPCLNTHPAWLDALADIVRQETLGWV